MAKLLQLITIPLLGDSAQPITTEVPFPENRGMLVKQVVCHLKMDIPFLTQEVVLTANIRLHQRLQSGIDPQINGGVIHEFQWYKHMVTAAFKFVGQNQNAVWVPPPGFIIAPGLICGTIDVVGAASAEISAILRVYGTYQPLSILQASQSSAALI